MATILHHFDRCNLLLCINIVCYLRSGYCAFRKRLNQPKDRSKTKFNSLRNLPFEINIKNCVVFNFNFWRLLINKISDQNTLINCTEIFNYYLIERPYNSTNSTRNKINNYSYLFSTSTNQL